MYQPSGPSGLPGLSQPVWESQLQNTTETGQLPHACPFGTSSSAPGIRHEHPLLALLVLDLLKGSTERTKLPQSGGLATLRWAHHGQTHLANEALDVLDMPLPDREAQKRTLKNARVAPGEDPEAEKNQVHTLESTGGSASFDWVSKLLPVASTLGLRPTAAAAPRTRRGKPRAPRSLSQNSSANHKSSFVLKGLKAFWQHQFVELL